MKKEFPDYTLKRKRLSKTKTVIIYRRNNLSLNVMRKIDGGYVYEEVYQHGKITCNFKMVVRSENVYDMFEADTKSFKIKGGKNGFGVFVRMNDGRLPRRICNTVGCVEYELNLEGEAKTMYFDNPKRKATQGVSVIHESSRSAVTVPNSVSWAAAHPFQGGGVSPK